jgi:cell division protein FtsQ
MPDGRGGRTGAGRGWRLVRARPDAVPASVRRFHQRIRQRRLRAAAPWLLGLAVLAVLGLVGWVVAGTPLLGVRSVEVVGATMVTPEQVRAAAGVPIGTPLVQVDLTEVAHRVDTLAPVRQAEVSRRWPSTLVVRVQERVPAATVAVSGGYLVLDASGVVFRHDVTRPPEVPLLRVANPGPDDAATRAALSVLPALTPQLRQRLRVLVAQAPTRISLELAEDRRIVWGDASDSAAKARVATSLLARPGHVIDVSAAEVVTVR